MIINSISGPRNISTAMMYAFAQHPEIKVVDEPFYGSYLIHTGIDHPGREEILRTMTTDPKKVLDEIKKLQEAYPILFLKNMAHHHEGLDWSYLLEMKNFFLIRDPKQLITSFSKVIPNPTLQDIGLKHEAEILDYICSHSGEKPIVLDTNEVLRNPEKVLSRLCEQLDIPFTKKMLSWTMGPIPEDGIWAKYWYQNVHQSTGFAPRSTEELPLRPHQEALYQEAMHYYNKLKKYELKTE